MDLGITYKITGCKAVLTEKRYAKSARFKYFFSLMNSKGSNVPHSCMSLLTTRLQPSSLVHNIFKFIQNKIALITRHILPDSCSSVLGYSPARLLSVYYLPSFSPLLPALLPHMHFRQNPVSSWKHAHKLGLNICRIYTRRERCIVHPWRFKTLLNEALCNLF